VTDGWIVISYAPEAVRANLRRLAEPTSPPLTTKRVNRDGT
jgi:hypothetical protein